MGNNQPPRYQDFSNAQSEKNKLAQRRINEQDEDHIDDEFIDRAPADYSQYQTESKPNENEFIQEGFLSDNNAEGDIADAQSTATNPDENLKEKISKILTKDREIDARDIHITVKRGTVLLTGTTQTRDEKIKVEMAIQDVKGVEDIKNNLKLRKWDQK